MSRFTKFTCGVLAWAVLDILWGALVRATGSGAGCGGHWPSCQGQIIPVLQSAQTIIEFTHRVLSGTALLLVLTLLIWGWRTYPKGHPVRIGLVGSAVFILTEALLGAGLVLFQLVADNASVFRAAAISLHLLNTFILLAFLTLTAWWASGGKAISLKNKGRLPVLFAIGLVGVAIIGMTGAITALGDTLLPAKSLAEGLREDFDSNANFLLQLRAYHPIIAILVGGYLLTLARYLYGRFNEKMIRRFCLILSGLILVQASAGVVNILLLAPIWLQLVHLFLADSVWISCILLSAAVLSVERE
ncbi:MAG: COX15/CtaA family protein [Anaerolineales bacterium]